MGGDTVFGSFAFLASMGAVEYGAVFYGGNGNSNRNCVLRKTAKVAVTTLSAEMGKF